MPQLKKGPKFALVILGGLALVFGLKAGMSKGFIPTPGILKSVVSVRVNLPSQSDALVQNVTALAYPSTSPASVSATRIPVDIWEWNAYFALLYANGGST